VIQCASTAEAGGTIDSLQDRVTTHCASHVEHAGKLAEKRVAVVTVGHGQLAAATAALEAIRLHRPQWLVAAGFATALDPGLKRGHVLLASEVVETAGNPIPIEMHLDPQSLRNNPGLHVGKLLTVERLDSQPERRRKLGEKHAAVACDLESWGAAEVCRQTGTRFLAVRIVTDEVNDTLPKDIDHLFQQKSAAGKLGAVAGSVWRRPSAVKDLWRYNEEALKASDRLARFLAGLLQNLPAW
jgi:adenosylhomocysteine nucleosidase